MQSLVEVPADVQSQLRNFDELLTGVRTWCIFDNIAPRATGTASPGARAALSLETLAYTLHEPLMLRACQMSDVFSTTRCA